MLLFFFTDRGNCGTEWHSGVWGLMEILHVFLTTLDLILVQKLSIIQAIPWPIQLLLILLLVLKLI